MRGLTGDQSAQIAGTEIAAIKTTGAGAAIIGAGVASGGLAFDASAAIGASNSVALLTSGAVGGSVTRVGLGGEISPKTVAIDALLPFGAGKVLGLLGAALDSTATVPGPSFDRKVRGFSELSGMQQLEKATTI